MSLKDFMQSQDSFYARLLDANLFFKLFAHFRCEFFGMLLWNWRYQVLVVVSTILLCVHSYLFVIYLRLKLDWNMILAVYAVNLFESEEWIQHRWLFNVGIRNKWFTRLAWHSDCLWCINYLIWILSKTRDLSINTILRVIFASVAAHSDCMMKWDLF